MSAIKEIFGRIIMDSRNEKTVEAHIRLESGAVGVASVPSGKSKGIHEAAAIEPEKSVEVIYGEIYENFLGKNFITQEDFDRELIELDGTPNKSRIGGNTTTALSAAFARASASERNMPLYKYVSDSLGNAPRGNLRLFANMIEGGLHAKNNLRFQEHWVIPKGGAFIEQINLINNFFKKLGEELGYKSSKDIIFSDEGSYSLDFEKEDEPFEIMSELRDRLGLSGRFDFGLDAAASSIEGATNIELENIYRDWAERFGLVCIEDPFYEEDFALFADLRKSLPKVIVVGDDLTTTNVELMEKAYFAGSINGVIIKPNQIGTITEALDAVRLARHYGWQVVVSHRSGETMDDWIADFTVGCGADGFKLGAPSRPERIAKYNRLLRIEKEIGSIQNNV